MDTLEKHKHAAFKLHAVKAGVDWDAVPRALPAAKGPPSLVLEAADKDNNPLEPKKWRISGKGVSKTLYEPK